MLLLLTLGVFIVGCIVWLCELVCFVNAMSCNRSVEEELSTPSIVVPLFLGFLSNQITNCSEQCGLYRLTEKLEFTKQYF